MTALEYIRRLWTHAARSDAALLDGVRGGNVPADALRELAHVVGAEEVWLSRLEGRPSRSAVWPEAAVDTTVASLRDTHLGYGAYLATLDDADLETLVTYTNSAGKTFSDSLGDILLHVMLHGQYHRGRINLLLRQAGAEPVPADYIAFVRGAAAATNR
jgi:uncharacterized damage-inducible protein DinB